MTPNEAIGELSTFPVNCLDFKENQALQMAIDALKENKLFHELGFDAEYLKSIDLDQIQTMGDAIRVFAEWSRFKAVGTVEEFQTLKEKSTIVPEFIQNYSDTVSLWKCSCGHVFKTTHNSGVLEGTDVYYCVRCGKKYDWRGEKE